MLERGDGRRITASLTMSPIKAGGREFHTAVLRDFTDVRLQRERMRQLSLVVDRSDNAIFVSAPNRQVLYVNSGFTRMLGYELEDLRNRKPSEVLSGPHTEPQLGDLIERSLALSEGMQTEVLLYTKSGRPLWVSAAINPVLDDDGRTIGLVSVLTDITQTKAHQVLHHKVLDAMVREQPVTDVMTLMCREVERIAPEVAVSVLAVDGDGRLRPLAAPSLPAALVAACDRPGDRTARGRLRHRRLARPSGACAGHRHRSADAGLPRSAARQRPARLLLQSDQVQQRARARHPLLLLPGTRRTQ